MIFILGGKGFLGSSYVRALDMAGERYEIITRENYENFKGKSCDILINASGNSKKYLASRDPQFDFRESVISVHNSLLDFHAGTYVYLSSGDVYPDTSSPSVSNEDQEIAPRQQSTYGFHKGLAENIVKHYAKQWLIIRQGGFVGEGLKKNVVFDILNDLPVRVSLESRFQFIDSLDSAQIVMQLLKKERLNETYNLTGLETISVAEIYDMCSRSPNIEKGSPSVTYNMSLTKISKLADPEETKNAIKKFLLSKQ